ncbi:4-diphosphocytidyl-2-C-methyl-D-erythritol kinase [Mucilaginibacter lappiensis]|uniref:4-diphosphocytidyl-2-C-methyl-D-erythritol kinase n=1 Tax=Mucilaginibacter lappiensis TaxID=354630 RepID=A0ABR6PMI7_9SPHI|nr:4-(cytidine 5'-diphospho)-2-C-methyl-D-erythritol kinase [Mucilaginibacter lappiensis]MBB6110993.1 4-diphosphocytidyl-2-C-methyl-D-erythritol kinase [Mucilaginibacter lappiensis]SIR66739.1 4-diphosphocytidyl-2-C-methyl-D-erythritol kinase [Mucilaginibacter lappiensis]
MCKNTRGVSLFSMILFPNAKINIGLNITERRPDGYHNLETIFYPINIKDALEVVVSDKLSFESSGLDIPGRVEDNLCIKGYHLLKNDHDLPPVSIHLHKNIPIGAGLGGGSADAAYFIRLMNQQFELGLSVEEMTGYARKLGADCAFFIENKPVFAFEKGDEFESIKLDLSNYKIALVMPDVHISTAEAFRGIKPSPVKESLFDLITEPITEWKKNIKNDFEASIFKNHVEIRGVKAALYEAGAIYASMSGSGASVFGIFEQTPDLQHLEAENEVFYDV